MNLPSMLFDAAQATRRWAETKKNLDALGHAVELYKSYLADRSATSAEKRAIATDWIPKLERQRDEELSRQRAARFNNVSGMEAVFLAEQYIGDGIYKDAQQLLDRVLSSHGNSREVIVAALERRAQVAMKFKQTEVAIEAYKRLLVLDPGFIVPDDAAMSSVFATAKKQLAGTRPLSVTQIPPGLIRKNQVNSIPVKIESDPLSMAVSFSLHYRTQGGGAFSSMTVPKAKGAVELPGEFVSNVPGNTQIEYYIVVLDEADGEVFLLGSAKVPFVVSVEMTEAERIAGEKAKPKTPVYKKGWFWGTLVGVAVVAGGSIALGLTLGRLNNPTEVGLSTQ